MSLTGDVMVDALRMCLEIAEKDSKVMEAHDYYRNVETIIVYPSTVVPPPRKLGFFENRFAPMDLAHPIIGQALQQGPVIIIWDAALHGGRHPELGHNVVYHEFAHKLDMLDAPRTARRRLRIGLNSAIGWRHVPVNICVSDTMSKWAGNLPSMPMVRRTKRKFSPSPQSNSSISRG